MLNHKLDLLLDALGIDDPFSAEKLYMVIGTNAFWLKGTYFQCLDFVVRCQSGLREPLQIVPYDPNF